MNNSDVKEFIYQKCSKCKNAINGLPDHIQIGSNLGILINLCFECIVLRDPHFEEKSLIVKISSNEEIDRLKDEIEQLKITLKHTHEDYESLLQKIGYYKGGE